jgi:hypothetical protein
VNIPDDSPEEAIPEPAPSPLPAEPVARGFRTVTFADDVLDLESISLNADFRFDWIIPPANPMSFTPRIDDFLEPADEDAVDLEVWG